MQDLISFVQERHKSKRENLASEVLSLLLKEAAGQKVLKELFGIESSKAKIAVATEREAGDCRPDIELMVENDVLGYLELKFWAQLTPAQLSAAYSSAIFIVPQERRGEVLSQLLEHAKGWEPRVYTWIDFLERLTQACCTDNQWEHRLFLGVIENFKEFCSVIEREHFVPFTADQLRRPVQNDDIRHLCWLTRELLAGAAEAGVTSKAEDAKAGFDDYFYYGQSVNLFGTAVWVGYWEKAWHMNRDLGPLWAQFGSRVARTLAKDHAFKDGMQINGNDFAFPLLPFQTDAVVLEEEEAIIALRTLTNLGERMRKVYPEEIIKPS